MQKILQQFRHQTRPDTWSYPGLGSSWEPRRSPLQRRLEVLSTDIQGAYLYAKPRENAYFIAGDEIGPNKGCVIVIIRALYGMKSSGAAFRSKLCEDLRELGYTNLYGDPDVWMRARANEKGNKYYEYIAVYVDDLLIFSHDPTYYCCRLVEIYNLKEGFNKPTTF